MQNIIAIITAIITYIASLFSAIPAFVENIKAKPDFSWIIQVSQTTEKSYEEYYDFYQQYYDYHRDNGIKAENLKDVTEGYQALLDENLAQAKEWRKTPGKGQIEFYKNIVDNGNWDYKRPDKNKEIAEKWGVDQNEPFAVYGVVMDWEILGNINFAFIGAAMGFTPTTMLTGGGLNEISHSGVKWEKLPYYFESEEDFVWLSFGFSLYSFIDESYEEQSRTIDSLLAITDPRIIGIAMKIYDNMGK